MLRFVHRWPGLLAALLLSLLALSGATLSVFPAAERLAAPQAVSGQSVADLASRIQAAYPGVEQIRRAPSGQITAYWFDNGQPGAAVIDPATGQAAGSADPNQTLRWLTNLHRSLFLGDGGRLTMAAGAAMMLVLCLSGALLVVRRTGGWRRWFAHLRGPLAGRLHVEIARIALPALLLSSLTALWMTASTFGLLPEGDSTPAFPTEVSGQTGASLRDMPLLAETPVSELRDLSFPYAGDATDAFTLTTARGSGYIDQGTGATLAWADLSGWQQAYETIYMLHTGQGAAGLGLLLGLMAFGVPTMAVTGVILWLAGRRGRPRIRHNVAPGRADTVILVGSESGTTWGFAATLQAALSAQGHSIHVAPMSSFLPDRYARAQRLLILAATYGEGAAPASAKGFLDRLKRLPARPGVALAVLGFGDRSFPAFCGFAGQLAETARARGWQELIPYDTVDRQSSQDFARWGRALGTALGLELELAHVPVIPASLPLSLISRRDYGAEVQAPTAILRFALPPRSLWCRLSGRGFGRFAPGDLLGVLPEGSEVARFYSLASGCRDGFVEIAVKKHPGGLCSAQLMALQPGDSVRAFIRRNPDFRPGPGKAPLILIGAGTGVAPLAGFLRGNTRHRPACLIFGLRHPDSDFLYREEFATWQQDGRLTRLLPAVSRGTTPAYVQDLVRREGPELARLIRDGARVLVCGGREMASGVTTALAEVLAPFGTTPTDLKAEGRYVEDVY